MKPEIIYLTARDNRNKQSYFNIRVNRNHVSLYFRSTDSELTGIKIVGEEETLWVNETVDQLDKLMKEKF